MKKSILFAVDVVAFTIIGVVAVAFAGTMCYGLLYVARSIFDYLTSYEGRGLAWAIAFSLTFWAATAWVRRRYDKPRHPCAVCGKPAVGMRTSDRALLCAYHTGQRP